MSSLLPGQQPYTINAVSVQRDKACAHFFKHTKQRHENTNDFEVIHRKFHATCGLFFDSGQCRRALSRALLSGSVLAFIGQDKRIPALNDVAARKTRNELKIGQHRQQLRRKKRDFFLRKPFA